MLYRVHSCKGLYMDARVYKGCIQGICGCLFNLAAPYVVFYRRVWQLYFGSNKTPFVWSLKLLGKVLSSVYCFQTTPICWSFGLSFRRNYVHNQRESFLLLWQMRGKSETLVRNSTLVCRDQRRSEKRFLHNSLSLKCLSHNEATDRRVFHYFGKWISFQHHSDWSSSNVQVSSFISPSAKFTTVQQAMNRF